MVENSLSGDHVFIFTFHLLGNQFSKIMSIFLRNTHIKDFKIRAATVARCRNLVFHVPNMGTDFDCGFFRLPDWAH
jgi:hypothetical protein